MMMSFGKHESEEISSVPNSYLYWLLLQDWFEDKEEFEDVVEEMEMRKHQSIQIEG